MDIPVVAVGGVVFRPVEDTFGCVIEVAVEFQEIALAGRDGAEECVGAATPSDLLNERFRRILIHFLQHTIEVGRDGGVVEERGQESYGTRDFVRRLEVTLEIEIEAVLAKGDDQVVHHALVIAVFLEPGSHGFRVETRVLAQVEQILLPFQTPGALGHASTHEGDNESALTGTLELFKEGLIPRKLVGIQHAGFLCLVEPLRFLVVEVAIAEVEGAARFGQRDLFPAALADDLNVRKFLVIENRKS